MKKNSQAATVEVAVDQTAAARGARALVRTPELGVRPWIRLCSSTSGCNTHEIASFKLLRSVFDNITQDQNTFQSQQDEALSVQVTHSSKLEA
jgi:hypothetical protein